MHEMDFKGNSNILIVDDVSANLVLLSEMIRELGYVPRPVYSITPSLLRL